MKKGGGERYEGGKHNERHGYGHEIREEVYITSNPITGNKWTLNDDDDENQIDVIITIKVM